MDSAAFRAVDSLAVNTLRFLAVDMVEAAKSGHPGAPLGQAPMAYALWSRHLRHDPADPAWWNRDRFVLSCGHASALLYALLHLFGYDLSLDELRRFRQLGSKTPGHPERGHTPGVETTTGPLGQGFGNAVGMAMAREMLAARFNRPPYELLDYRVWCLASDGDLMEGVASEAASLAGHQRLAALKVLYDDNHVSIDGPTSLSFSEDVPRRFEAYGWRVLRVADGNDLEEIAAALEAAASETERPTLVAVRTVIGYGAPHKQGTAEAHGEPLGPAEAAAAKAALGWPPQPTFLVPEEVRADRLQARCGAAARRQRWTELWQGYRLAQAELATELERRMSGALPAAWEESLPRFSGPEGAMATREASGRILTALAGVLPELAGGSADLTPSNKTLPKGASDFSPHSRSGRYLRFGVREHGMAAALNGMQVSGGLRVFGGTFLVFSDYMRPSIRLAAMMGLPVVYVFTHDSIFLGEDGPTHQPVDQLASLRAIPNLVVLRPADANETAAAWRLAIARRDGPTALALTRQKLPLLPGPAAAVTQGVGRGGYVVSDRTGTGGAAFEAVLVASGSEVTLCLDSQRLLAEEGIGTRVVSLPSWELFLSQKAAYRDDVLPPAVPRLAVEAAGALGWHRFLGDRGAFHGMTRFGASAPATDLAGHFEFTARAVADRVFDLLREAESA